jgi:hypothetical protein
LKSKEDATGRAGNFQKRLAETMDSELSPEMVTPNTAGSEELSDYDEKFPLVNEFRQTNMRSGGRRIRDGQRGLGRDNE